MSQFRQTVTILTALARQIREGTRSLVTMQAGCRDGAITHARGEHAQACQETRRWATLRASRIVVSSAEKSSTFPEGVRAGCGSLRVLPRRFRRH
jgi:hypothetical protein